MAPSSGSGSELALRRDVYWLGDFRSLAPRHLTPQAQTLDWLAQVHTRAERVRAGRSGDPVEEASFLASMRRRLTRFGCDADTIATRGHELDDCSHERWDDMEVYAVGDEPRGAGMRSRTTAFGRVASAAMQQLFDGTSSPPQHLIHVTCTGYEAPSAGQRLVASKGWGTRTCVTHAYHMGCYAALPALRMATGFVADAAGRAPRACGDMRVEIVHTEICSLHLHPLRHEAEQLVIQSLFADGCIGYSVRDRPEANGEFGFEILAQDEWLVPGTETAMRWLCSDFGMEMTLARDVPTKLASALPAFVTALLDRARLPRTCLDQAVFAVHPGGPKIIDQIAAALSLTEPQVAFSRAVLRARGNMSSATLPHVWQAIALSRDVPPDAIVISLAFGPGLTLAGSVARKARSC